MLLSYVSPLYIVPQLLNTIQLSKSPLKLDMTAVKIYHHLETYVIHCAVILHNYNIIILSQLDRN